VTTNGCGQQEAVVCLTRRQPALRQPMVSKTGSYFFMNPKTSEVSETSEV